MGGWSVFVNTPAADRAEHPVNKLARVARVDALLADLIPALEDRLPTHRLSLDAERETLTIRPLPPPGDEFEDLLRAAGYVVTRGRGALAVSI
jgi:hypothetical protein